MLGRSCCIRMVQTMIPLELLADIDNETTCIIAVLGNLGHGKTLTAVSLATMLKLINEELGNDVTILSNTPLNVEHEFLERMNQLQDRRNTIMLIDEFYLIADSYSWQSSSSFMTVDISMDLRKRNNKIILTSQYYNQIAKRVRQLITLFIKPQRVNDFIFKLNLANVGEGADFDYCMMNLKPFINVYDTHYKPMRLIENNEGDDE